MSQAQAADTVLDEILSYNHDRKRALVKLKLERMNENAFAFFRGTNNLFARDWAELKPKEVGPAILICGDLHLENFGSYRTDTGDFLYDINDFDEALVAPCGIDLVRCATSILLVAQLWRLTPVQAMRTVLAFLDEYRTTISQPERDSDVKEMSLRTGKGPIRKLLGACATGDQAQLLRNHTRRTKSGGRRIRLIAGRQGPISEKRAEFIRAAVESYGDGKGASQFYEVLDVAGRIAGIGSLGLRRYIVLVRGEVENRLLDIKEECPSALLACPDCHKQPPCGSEAERVVEAQRSLQARPTAHLDVVAVGGQSFRMRELIAVENRSRLDRLRKRPAKLRRAVEIAGRLTAWAHERGCRIVGNEKLRTLRRWAEGPSLDAVLSAAVRFAERTRREYVAFHRAYTTADFARNGR